MKIKTGFMILLTAFITGICASAIPAAHAAPAEESSETARVNNIFAGIAERNRTVKKTPEWLKQAYGSYQIRKLNDIPPAEYGSYKQFLHKGREIFIVVHPAFYVFFQNTAILSSPSDSRVLPDRNIVQRFGDRLGPDSPQIRVVVEQERLIRDFLEYASDQKKLVVLVLPRDAKNHALYGVIPGLDEYARYINECTNGSDAIVYVESEAFDNGFLRKEELDVMDAFVKAVGATRISLGGGYISRCVDNCYSSLRLRYPPQQIAVVPEILVLSPVDNVNTGALAGSLMTAEGRIRFSEVTTYLNNFGLSVYSEDRKQVSAEQPRIRRLSLYKAYR